jgi:hypothetical protein
VGRNQLSETLPSTRNPLEGLTHQFDKVLEVSGCRRATIDHFEGEIAVFGGRRRPWRRDAE